MNPRVKLVVARDDYTLEITFTNGEIRIYDCSSFPHEGGMFQEFQDIEYFKQATVGLDTVVWPHEQDICPDTLYEGSKKLISN
jgi:hypothetical protein